MRRELEGDAATRTVVPFFRPAIGAAEIEAAVATMKSGWLTTGERAREFETRFAEYLGAEHAVALNSCTAALHLALESLEIRAGEIVLVPTFTFPATAEVVTRVGARPLFVDVDPETLCIDPVSVERTLDAVSRGEAVGGQSPPFGRVRAMMPVHYGGHPCDSGALGSIAVRHRLAIVEDCAHALPSFERSGEVWKAIGSGATVSCFSFYANKCITTGEGGMALTGDPELAERIRLLSLHGIERARAESSVEGESWRYDVVAPGFKYNMPDLSAAIGVAQLARIDQFATARRAVAGAYSRALREISALKPPIERAGVRHSWHLFVVRLREGRWSIDRDEFVRELRRRGVEASAHFKPLHLHSYYRERLPRALGEFPVAEDAWRRVVSLPIYPEMTGEEQRHVIAMLGEVARRHSL